MQILVSESEDTGDGVLKKQFFGGGGFKYPGMQWLIPANTPGLLQCFWKLRAELQSEQISLATN